jgi:hypothetical protein
MNFDIFIPTSLNGSPGFSRIRRSRPYAAIPAEAGIPVSCIRITFSKNSGSRVHSMHRSSTGRESRLQCILCTVLLPHSISGFFSQSSAEDTACPLVIPPLKCRHVVVGTRFCASAAPPNAGNAVLEQRPLPILPTAFHGDPAKTSTPESSLSLLSSVVKEQNSRVHSMHRSSTALHIRVLFSKFSRRYRLPPRYPSSQV